MRASSHPKPFVTTALLAALIALVPAGRAAAQARQADSVEASAPGTTHVLGEVEQMPRVLNAREVWRQIQRGYPADLRRAGVTGMVMLRFRVTAAGTADTSSIEVVQSSNEGFNAPAIAAAARMRFSPATLDRRPVAVWVTLPFSFDVDPAHRPRTDSAP
jgi:TonB family protein